MDKLPKINPNQPIAIDLETCDPELKYTAPGYISNVGFVAGIAICAEEGAWYIPINHAEGDNYDKGEVINWLNEVCAADTDKIFHNAQYDVGWLKAMGVQLHGFIFDTMLAAPLLDENRFSYDLDSLGKTYIGEGKYEDALTLAVQEKFGKMRTHKAIIRLKENVSCSKYPEFINAKKRTSQFYELWPKEVQDRYDVLGFEKSATGQELFLVPTKRKSDIKSLLWACSASDMGTYPEQDVELTYALYKKFKKMLEAEKLERLMHMENELCPVLLEMREKGVRIDMDKAVELDKQYTAELDRLQEELNTKAGMEVNVDVTDDLVKVCEKFGIEYSHTEKGNPSFNSELIPKDEYGIFDVVLAIRKFRKARDTYIRGYIFGCTLDGWLHGQYNQLKSDDGGTVTGRLSSSNPNMQNLPNPKKDQIGKDIRGLFLPDNDKEKWLSMDYSGQEPKMLVHAVLALEKKGRMHFPDLQGEYFKGSSVAALPEFRGREADFHTAVATICVKKEFALEGKTPTEDEIKAAAKAFRAKAKSIGLGVMYGSGNAKVAAEMTKKGFPMTTTEAADIRANIYDGVPFLKTLSEYLMKKAADQGYIRTILGRKGRFDMWECSVYDKDVMKRISNANYGFKSAEEAWAWYRKVDPDIKDKVSRPQRAGIYKALNKYIQGSSADQTKVAMLDLYKRGDRNIKSLDIYYRRIKNFEPPKFKTQVHDEVNVSLTDNEDFKWYQDVMENCLPLQVEVVADPVVCTKWSEAK